MIPLHRFQEFISLSDAELDALERARTHTVEMSRRQSLRRQGDPVNEVYLLASGWVASCVDTSQGRRQIVKIHLPGDILGSPSIALERAAETLTALTPVKVEVIPVEAFARLFETVPRLGFAMFLNAQQERVMLMDRVTSLGQTQAPQRLAALLLHVHERLKLAEPRVGKSFELPLTQEELAQATGLTSVHINRTFQELDRRGVIKRNGRRFTLLDTRALRELASLPTRELVRDASRLIAGDTEMQAAAE